MLSWFKGTAGRTATARELYGAVVARARAPAFYAVLGVPDTPEGRYELIALHLALLLERLNRQGEAGRGLAQLLAETFVTDMDDNMREMGVGDLAVPRRVKRAAAGLYERAQRYREALAPGTAPGALTELVRELVLSGQPPVSAAGRLAGYVRQSADALANQSDSELLAGKAGFAFLTV